MKFNNLLSFFFLFSSAAVIAIGRLYDERLSFLGINISLVISKDDVNKNINSKKFQLIDARGEKRFLGLQPEPRKELRSGNIKGSINLPFQKLLEQDRTFKKKNEFN